MKKVTNKEQDAIELCLHNRYEKCIELKSDIHYLLRDLIIKTGKGELDESMNGTYFPLNKDVTITTCQKYQQVDINDRQVHSLEVLNKLYYILKAMFDRFEAETKKFIEEKNAEIFEKGFPFEELLEEDELNKKRDNELRDKIRGRINIE